MKRGVGCASVPHAHRPRRELHRHAVVHVPPAQCRVLRSLHVARALRRRPARCGARPPRSSSATRAPASPEPARLSPTRRCAASYTERVLPASTASPTAGSIAATTYSPILHSRCSASATPPQRHYAAGGRAGFILVQVSHALVEGADSALLARSRSAAHPVARSDRNAAPARARLPRPESAPSSQASTCSLAISSPFALARSSYASRAYPRAAVLRPRAPATAFASARCSSRS